MVISDEMEDLVYRILSGEASKAERERFDSWLKEREEHRIFYRNCGGAWYAGRYAMKWESVREEGAWNALEQKHIRRKRKQMLRIGLGMAASILVIVGMIGIFSWLNRDVPPEAFVQLSGSKPGMSKAFLVLSTGEKLELGKSSVNLIQESGVNIRNVGDQVSYEQGDSVSVDAVVYNELVVPAGGEYRLRLSDGSLVFMNSGSRLRYPIQFQGETREVELEGEAFFEVAENKKFPFIVHTDLVDVKVLGTRFNVMAYREDVRTEVTLEEGKVDVACGAVSEVLTPDHQFVLDNNSCNYQVRTVDVNVFVAWKNGVLNFDAMPLDELTRKLSRWYDVKFFFTSENLKRLKFSGAVKKYNNIDYILSIIEATTNVTFKMDDKGVIVVCEK